MSQKKLIGVAVLGLLGLAGMPGMAATTVYVTDGATGKTSCGTLSSLSTSPSNVELVATGNCLGSTNTGGSVTQAVPITGITVTEGSSKTIDIANYGVTVKLPFTVTGVTQPAAVSGINSMGSTSVISNSSQLSYVAPVAGTIGTTPQNTSFSYTIQDASGGSSTSSVSLTVNPGTTGGGNTGTCVTTAALLCKGVISLDNVEIRNNQLSPGVMHVWTFTFDRDRKGYFTQVGGEQKTVIISSSPDNSLQNPISSQCIQTTWGNTGIFSFNSQANASVWDCPLQVGQTYYLKFKLNGNVADANYFLKTVDTTLP